MHTVNVFYYEIYGFNNRQQVDDPFSLFYIGKAHSLKIMKQHS